MSDSEERDTTSETERNVDSCSYDSKDGDSHFDRDLGWIERVQEFRKQLFCCDRKTEEREEIVGIERPGELSKNDKLAEDGFRSSKKQECSSVSDKSNVNIGVTSIDRDSLNEVSSSVKANSEKLVVKECDNFNLENKPGCSKDTKTDYIVKDNKQNSSFEELGNLSLSYNKPGCSRDSASPGSKIRMGIRKPPKFTGPKKVLFKGDPGSGKTTISKKVHSDWVQGIFTAVTIIFFVSMKLVKPGDPIENVIIQQKPVLEAIGITHSN